MRKSVMNVFGKALTRIMGFVIIENRKNKVSM